MKKSLLAIAAFAAYALSGSAAELSNAIKDKMQFWVAADDASHLVSDEISGHLFWYDKRETDTSAPSFVYAESGATTPITSVVGGKAVVDFGSIGSGRYMTWKKSGTKISINTYNIRHVFAVCAATDSFGNVFGTPDSGRHSSFVYSMQTTSANTLGSPYFWNRGWSIMWNGRFYIDGRRSDGHREKPNDGVYRHGFHLFEAEPSLWKNAAANAFFIDQGNTTCSGGGYLCEAISFTNTLTEVERLQVEDYLMERWSLGTRDEVVHVASGETLTWDTSGGAVAVDRLRLEGDGSVVKTGAAAYTYASRNSSGFGGTLRIDSGMVNLTTPIPVAVMSGDRFTVTPGADGRQVARASSASTGSVVKDGDGELYVQAVPASVKRLDVNSGELYVCRRPVNASTILGTPVPVAIANAGFEEYDDGELVNGCKTPGTTGFHGWYSFGAWVFNWSQWTAASSEAGNLARTNYGQMVPPAEGDCAMLIKKGPGTYAYTVVSIPSPGVYRLSANIYGQGNGGHVGARCAAVLRDPETKEAVADFGELKFEDSTRYREKTFTANVPAAGQYELCFSYVAGDGCVIDNLALAKVAEMEPDVFWIPDGNFEHAAMLTGDKACGVISNGNTCAGWTLSRSTGDISANNPEVAFVTRSMSNSDFTYCGVGGYYNDSRAPAGGYVELLFRASGTSASTAFTAPAGTHWLRCQTAFYHTTPATLEATVEIDGEPVSLGTLSPNNKLMRARCFPVPFVLETAKTVTLKISCTAGSGESGAWVDDLALVAHNDEVVPDNLVVNGDFESTSGWTHNNSNYSSIRPYMESTSVFGADPSDGLNFLSLARGGIAKQSVTFGETGRYRLRFRYRNWNNYSEYSMAPVVVRLVGNGVSIPLCKVGVDKGTRYFAYVDEVADFDIADTGSYELQILAYGSTESGQKPRALVDDVEIRRIADRFDGAPDVFHKDLHLRVAAGGHVTLGYSGAQRIGTLRLGGRHVSGAGIGAATHPEYFSGQGTLDVVGGKFIITIR